MREIKVQQLNEEAFRKYGMYQSLTDNEQMKSRVIPCGSFYPDLLTLDLSLIHI